ncbi:MAG: hypothetical protein ACF8LK_08410 [Phycisphaerales bacterium JB041]
MHDAELLFHEHDLGRVIDAQREKMLAAIDGLTDAELLTDDPDSLVERITAEYCIAPIQLNADDIRYEEGETKVDVSRSAHYRFLGGPQEVTATEYRFFVPFEGDRDLFRCQPSSFDLCPPRAEISGHEMVIRVVKLTDDMDAAAIRKAFNEVLSSVRTYLDRQANDLRGLHDRFRETAARRIEQRRAKRRADADVGESLGFPKRGEQSR